MAANWYFARHKQKLGPFSFNQLRQLATFGLLQRTDHVLEEGTRQWREAGGVEGLIAKEPGGTEYHLAVAGKTYGPYTADQIRIYLMAGRLTATTLAYAKDKTKWVPLTEFAEFAACMPRTSESNAVLVLDKGPDISKEEAELHLAGKTGDPMARLISRLMDLKRQFSRNPSLEESIDRNIKHLMALREQRGPWGGNTGLHEKGASRT
jgi:hypothetical protein